MYNLSISEKGRADSMKSAEIGKVAKKLGWKRKELVLALEEFLEADSPLKKDGLISICAQSSNPDERLKNSIEYFVNHYKDGAVELISDLLRNFDPCFQLIALFNIYDFYTGKEETEISLNKGGRSETVEIVLFERPNSKVSWELQFTKPHKSFIHWWTTPSYIEADHDSFLFQAIEEHLVTTFEDIAHIPEKLKYKFLNIYIKYLEYEGELDKLFSEPTSYIDNLQPLFRQVVKRVGYLAFNIEAFRRQINYFCRLPNFKECRISLEKLNETITPTAKTKISMTKRKYWLWYVFIEKLQENTYGVLRSFRKAVEILGESTEKAIARRYFEMKKEAKKKGLSADNIIEKHNLDLELKKLLIAADVIEEESLFEFQSLPPAKM